MSLLSRATRNRTIGIKLLEDEGQTSTPTDPNHDPWQNVQVAAAYAEIAKDVVTHTALTIGGVWAACKIIGRICK